MQSMVQQLSINYKVLEEFKKFHEYGIQELSMLEDLQNDLIEDQSDSPFYGIYFEDKLAARMSLYRIPQKYDYYFEPPQDYLELWKLEVLPDDRGKGYGDALVQFAKQFNLPIKTNGRTDSSGFWEKQGFDAVTYDPERDRGENPYVWYPQGVKERNNK